VGFIVVLQLICFAVLDGGHLSKAAYALFVVVPVLLVVVFALAMVRLIDRAQWHVVGQNRALAEVNAELERRKGEGHAFYDVLLQISNQSPSGQVLSAVVDNARNLLASDGAGLCLDDEAMFLVKLDDPAPGATLFGKGTVCSVSHECVSPCVRGSGACPVRRSPEWYEKLAVPVRGPWGALGELWIARHEERPYTERDREFLVSLAGLVEIALAGARARELEHEGAVLEERHRIAREMHDGVAQVLGATHLRLRALGPRAEVGDRAKVVVELEELADLCDEAYRDVREAILGLRESTRFGRGLVDSLRTYVEKFSQQSGIETLLVCDVEHDLELSPRCEVQVVRVIQEALTNARKHAGATKAFVRVSETDHSTLFTVEDDGAGFDAAAMLERDGYGLHSMRDRMLLLNGRLTVDSAPGRGTRVVAEIPVLSPSRTALSR